MILCGVLFAVQLVSAAVQCSLVFVFQLCVVTINQMIDTLSFAGPFLMLLLSERYARFD